MTVTDICAALEIAAKGGWFADRSPDVRKALAAVLQLRNFAAGQAIYRFGDAPNGIHGLISGAIDVAIPRADGVELVMHRADPGFWVGDLALLAGQRRLVSVIAAEPTQVLHLPSAEVMRLLERDPRFYLEFYDLSHRNMATALKLLANLAIAPSEARVAVRLLMHHGERHDGRDEVSLSHGKLAEMVALSLPTVERVLRKLQERGAVELGYGKIRILDRHGLQLLVNDQYKD